MKQQIEEVVTKTKIYCDYCGREISQTYDLSVIVYKDSKLVAEYGLGFTDTGDWCKSCRDELDYLLEQALRKVLIERYEIDHSGQDKTKKFYKKVLEG
jgi:hypothetical protein